MLGEFGIYEDGVRVTVFSVSTMQRGPDEYTGAEPTGITRPVVAEEC